MRRAALGVGPIPVNSNRLHAMPAEMRDKGKRICLAGSGRDQLQSIGFGKEEQLLEERGWGPELLAAGLQNADQHTLCMRALFGAVSAPYLARNHLKPYASAHTSAIQPQRFRNKCLC